jgi:hypothetical protein
MVAIAFASLDEAANYPLSSLTSQMSEGGGTRITTTVVLQSLAPGPRDLGRASGLRDLGGGSNA